MSTHQEVPFYKLNAGKVYHCPEMPLPPKEGMPLPINDYADIEDEVKFDPKIHLDLKIPEYVSKFPDFKYSHDVGIDKNTEEQMDSPIAFSAPFQVLSDEGLRVIRQIVAREKLRAVGPEASRGQKHILRGLYYLSPFIRDLQRCEELRELFEKLTGQKLISHPSISSSPQVNISIPGNHRDNEAWHWDSVAFVGVILLSDNDGMIGGELELMAIDKFEGMKKMAQGIDKSELPTLVVNYDKPGKMIFAQGSELLHHVTPVLTDHTRMALILCYGPANVYTPSKIVFRTMKYADAVHKMAEYEFFREKSWQAMHVLKSYIEDVKYTNDGQKLSDLLAIVADELKRASDILSGKLDDTIQCFDEINKKLIGDFSNIQLSTKPTEVQRGVL